MREGGAASGADKLSNESSTAGGWLLCLSIHNETKCTDAIKQIVLALPISKASRSYNHSVQSDGFVAHLQNCIKILLGERTDTPHIQVKISLLKLLRQITFY